MKSLLLVSLSFLSLSISAQVATFDYQMDNLNPGESIDITAGTKTIVIKGAAHLKNFNITVKDLPAKHKLVFKDDVNVVIGTYTSGDGTKSFTTAADLNNAQMTIVFEDDKGVQKPFAGLTVLEELPPSSLDFATPFLAANQPAPCSTCDYDNNAIVYSFSQNKIEYTNKKWPKWSRGRPIVGQPYSFVVKNINPFRDSVIISSETNDYNTDVPDLFTKAFFSAALQARNPTTNAILSDVFAMGKQLETLKSAIGNARGCDNICASIQQAKTDIETHFQTKYSFNPASEDLFTFLAKELAPIPAVYRDSVVDVLNSYRTFINARNYFIYNIPVIQNVDEYTFNLSVIPKSGATLPTIVDHQPISVHTVGGFKFDFSSGLFLTKLRDEHFTLKPDSTVIHNSYGGDSIVFKKRNQIILQNDQKKVDFGVAALMHFYPRISTVFNVSLTLGAGLSIGPNPSIRYLGGGSLLFGKSGRFILSYGCAAGFVDALADGYLDKQYVSYGDVNSNTKKTFKTSSFWSLSFNIPLFKSKVTAGTTKEDSSTKADDSSKSDDSSSDKKD